MENHGLFSPCIQLCSTKFLDTKSNRFQTNVQREIRDMTALYELIDLQLKYKKTFNYEKLIYF